MVIPIHQRRPRKWLSGVILGLLFISGLGISDRARSFGLVYEGLELLKDLSKTFYVGFYGNDHYTRVFDHVVALSGVDSYLSLGLHMTKQVAYHSPGGKIFLRLNDATRLMMGKPTCNPVPVHIDSPALKSRLAIHSGCIGDSEPIWWLRAIPPEIHNHPSSDNLLPKSDSDELAFVQLWHEMTGSNLKSIMLHPYEEKGENKLTLYACKQPENKG